MNLQQFSRAAALTRLTARGVSMARRHLVDGEPQATIAAEHGVTQGRVAQCCAAVRRAAEPRVPVTVEVPPARVGELRAFARGLR